MGEEIKKDLPDPKSFLKVPTVSRKTKGGKKHATRDQTKYVEVYHMEQEIYETSEGVGGKRGVRTRVGVGRRVLGECGRVVKGE